MGNGIGDSRGNRYRRLLAERLKAELAKKVASGMTGTVIGERFGIAQTYVSQITLGRYVPSIERSIDILESMGIDIEIKDRAVN